MACVLNSGVLRECGHSFGGLKELWLGNFDDIQSMEYDTDGAISGVTLAVGATIFEFQFAKDTGQALEELQKNGASSMIMQTLNFQLTGINLEKRKVLNDLSLAKVFAIVKKSDNKYWFYGDFNRSAGLEAVTLSNDTGTAQADGGFASVSIQGMALEYATTIPADLVETLASDV